MAVTNIVNIYVKNARETSLDICSQESQAMHVFRIERRVMSRVNMNLIVTVLFFVILVDVDRELNQ